MTLTNADTVELCGHSQTMTLVSWKIVATWTWLVNKLPKRPIHFAKQFLKDYYQEKGVVENSFHFLTVGEEEIENLLNGLTASKATGLDSLPARFLKDGAEVIACPLAHIINLSLHSSQMKNARVVPLYKNKVKLSLETIDLFPCSVLLPKFLRE